MKIMHGSVSQPPIEELAMEYAMLISNPDKGAQYNDREAHLMSYLRGELVRRCGPEHANTHIQNALDILKMVSF